MTIEQLIEIWQLFKTWSEQATPEVRHDAEMILYLYGAGGIIGGDTVWYASWDDPVKGIDLLKEITTKKEEGGTH